MSQGLRGLPVWWLLGEAWGHGMEWRGQPHRHGSGALDEAAGRAGRRAGTGPGGGASTQCLCGRFCEDVAWMTGRRPGLYWRVTWKVVSPLLLLTILVAYIALLAGSPPSYRAWDPGYVSPLMGPQGPWTHCRPALALALSRTRMALMGDICTLSDCVGSLCYVTQASEPPASSGYRAAVAVREPGARASASGGRAGAASQ